jgi:arabinose-5-phosphate isomerase
MKNFLEKYRRGISILEQQKIDETSISALERDLQASNSIVITGMGASLILAEKFAHHLRSLGKPASPIPVSDFLHGDMGILENVSCIVLLTKSGNTSESSIVLDFALNHGCSVHVISEGNPNNSREWNWIQLPSTLEADKYNLLPTVSFVVMSIFLDQIIMTLVETDSHFPLNFASRHPSGALGQLLNSPIEQHIRETIDPFVLEVGNRIPLILLENKLGESARGIIPFVDNAGKLLAVISDGDLRRHRYEVQIEEGVSIENISRIGTIHPRNVERHEQTSFALKRMLDSPEVSTLVIVDSENNYLGIVHARDLLAMVDK